MEKDHIETYEHREQTCNMYELYNLPEEEEEKLKEHIQEHQGLIRIFIHPLATNTTDEPDRVYKVLGKSLVSKKSPPVFILENEKDLSSWKNIVTDKHVIQDIYTVPTIHDYGYPLLPDVVKPASVAEERILTEDDFDYVESGFIYFIQKLEKLGVTRILVGGRNLEIIDGHLNRCVGNFINFIKTYGAFDVKLSLGTTPLNRTDMKDTYPDLL